MKKFRIGTVPYLNARPLVAMLEAGLPNVDLVEAVPSRLAVLLERREIDAAMVSSVVSLSDPSLCALGAGAVVSDGPVRSIRLMSKVPVRDIRRVALDTSSRTSVVLCRVLLEKVYGARPEVVSMPPDMPAMLREADAALMIGDPALAAALALERGELPQVKEDLDLGAVWRSETGLPFVYAVWTSPREADVQGLTELLTRAKEWGVARRDELADQAAPQLGLPAEFCRRYLRENVYHDYGPREREGLSKFQAYACELGLLPERTQPLECGGCADGSASIQAS